MLQLDTARQCGNRSIIGAHRQLIHHCRLTGLHFRATCCCVSTVGLGEQQVREYIRQQVQSESGLCPCNGRRRIPLCMRSADDVEYARVSQENSFYEASMRHVGTFLQISKITERTVRHALRTGRVILGFEIVAPLPSCGFWVERDGKPVGTVGDQVAWQPGLSLRCALPTKADIRIICNGKPVHQASVDACVVPISAPGVYRLEAFVTLAGERWPWVISNPIYVAKARAANRPG